MALSVNARETMGGFKRALTKERLIRWGFYDLATAYQSVYVNLLKPPCPNGTHGARWCERTGANCPLLLAWSDSNFLSIRWTGQWSGSRRMDVSLNGIRSRIRSGFRCCRRRGRTAEGSRLKYHIRSCFHCSQIQGGFRNHFHIRILQKGRTAESKTGNCRRIRRIPGIRSRCHIRSLLLTNHS